MKIGLLVVLLLAAAHVGPTVQTELTVTAVNKLNRARVLTNGPIRVMFELVYEPFEENGAKWRRFYAFH